MMTAWQRVALRYTLASLVNIAAVNVAMLPIVALDGTSVLTADYVLVPSDTSGDRVMVRPSCNSKDNGHGGDDDSARLGATAVISGPCTGCRLLTVVLRHASIVVSVCAVIAPHKAVASVLVVVACAFVAMAALQIHLAVANDAQVDKTGAGILWSAAVLSVACARLSTPGATARSPESQPLIGPV